ncbi:hypothetical protein MJD09_20570 [bacterium]|nr:hypothetical protein [bacterium]
MKLRYVGIGMAALLFLLLASFIEHLSSPNAEMSWILSNKTWIGFFKELGIAFLIALLIIFTIDQHTKRMQQSEVRDQLEGIKRNVFEAVFGIRAPKSIRDRTFDLILGQSFFRTKYRILYQLELKEFERTDGSSVKGILMHGHSSFTVENISNNRDTYTLNIEIQKPTIRAIKGLEEHAHMPSVLIDGEERTARQPTDTDRTYFDQSDFRTHLYDVPLDPGQRAEISFSLSAIRGLDDQEIFLTFLPCDGMTLQLEVPPDLDTFGAFSLHEKEANRVKSYEQTGFYEWELRYPMLPYEGFLIWWRYSDSAITTES